MSEKKFNRPVSANKEKSMSIETDFADPSAFAVEAARTMSRTSRARVNTARYTKGTETVGGLIEQLKAGDQQALEKLFNLYSAKLYSVAWRILGGDVQDAEEVIQDVFLTAFR